MKKFFQKYSWESLLFLFFLLVFFLNFPFQNGLFGWDNLMNEFDLWLNFKRALFSSVWIDNQGLGHIGGHGHAGLFFHVISLALIKIIFPFLGEFLIRPIFIFLLYILGGFGVFKLSDYIFKNKKIGFWSAIFYSVNLMTIQQFYLPLESFIVFHGILPWALVSLLGYWHKPNKKTFIFFFFVQLYFSQIGFLPPLFVVYFILLACLFFSFFLFNFSLKKWKDFFQKTFIIGLTILLVNLYWLIGTIAYTFSGSSYDYLHSLNNRISTPSFNENSISFGNFDNIALGESFFFHTYDQDLQSGQLYKVFQPWLDWFNLISVQFTSYLLFGIVLIGWFVLFFCKFKTKQKKAILFGFWLFLLFSLISLGQNIFIFKPIIGFIKKIPVVNQAFRAAFTKFSVPFALVESLFFSLGLIYLTRFLKKIETFFRNRKNKSFQNENKEKLSEKKDGEKIKLKLKSVLNPSKIKIKNQENKIKIKSKLGFILLILIFIFYSFPIWQGNFFFKTLKTKMPHEYQQVFDFFKAKKNWGRIALLPLNSNWGWHFYDWNYTGSGFLWYGLNQSILDRSFDSWSNYNESFYLELKEAVYKEDKKQFSDVFNKYKINYLIIDKNLVAPGSHSNVSYLDQISQLLEQSQFYQAINLGDIKIYQINDGKGEKLLAPDKVSLVASQERFLRFDPIYQSQGDYVFDQTGTTYPFLDLASSREIDRKKLEINNQQIGYKAKLNLTNENKIIFPKLQNGQPYNFDIYIQKKDQNNFNLHLKTILPQLEVDGAIYKPQSLASVTVPNVGFYNDFSLNIGEQIFPIDWRNLSENSWRFLGRTNLTFGEKLKVRFFKENLNKKVDLTDKTLKSELKNCQNGNLSAQLSKKIDGKKMILTGEEKAGCLSFRIGKFTNDDLPAFLRLNLKYKDKNVTPRLCLAREGDSKHICYNGQNFNPILDSETEQKTLKQYLVLIQDGTYWLDLGIFPTINDKTEFILEELSYEFVNNVTDVFINNDFWLDLENYYSPKLSPKQSYLIANHASREINSWLDEKKYDFSNSNNCQPEKIGNAYLEFSDKKMLFRSNNGGASCYNEFFPYVDLKKDQLLVIENNYKKGKGLEFNLRNLNSWQIDRLDLLRTDGQHYYALSAFPESQYRGYDLSFSNYAAMNAQAESSLSDVKFMEYPNEYLASIKLEPSFATDLEMNLDLKNIKKLGSFLHWADLNKNNREKELVVLNDGYHDLWQGYVIQNGQWWNFAKNQLMKTKFNGWANGFWVDRNSCRVSESCQIIIIFWPGIWQMIAWIVLLITTIGVVGWWRKR